MAIHAKGRKRWRVRLWHKGKQHEWIANGSKEDAAAFEARKRLELEAGSPSGPTRTAPIFGDFCVTRYRPHAELHLRKSSWYAQSFMLETLIDHFGPLKLTEIRDEHVDSYIRARRKPQPARKIEYQRRLRDGRMVQVSYEKKAGPPLGAVAINNELRTLRRVCSFARERKTPIADFKIEMLSEGERRPKAWSAEQLGALLDGCAGHAKEVLPMLVFLANTGARKGEVLALTWDCVDLERREVRIWPSAEWRPKNGKPREIPISDALLPWLSGTKASEKWVFPSGSGERFAFWPKRQWARACEAAKLSGGPHRLRHTFASMFLAQQPDLGLLAVILGHSDEAVTRLYAHMLPARLAKARNVVSVSPPIGAAVFAASQAWGKATVQDADKTGAETGAESAGAAR